MRSLVSIRIPFFLARRSEAAYIRASLARGGFVSGKSTFILTVLVSTMCAIVLLSFWETYYPKW